MRVTRRNRRLAYRIARQAWIDASGDAELAEYKAKGSLDDVGLPPWLVEILITIVVQLIVKWLTDKITTPEEMPSSLLGADDDE